MQGAHAGLLGFGMGALLALVSGGLLHLPPSSAAELRPPASAEQVATASPAADRSDTTTRSLGVADSQGTAPTAASSTQRDQEGTSPMTEKFRRVVTGQNAAGQSIIAKDTEITPTMYGVWPQIDFWKTTTMPASLTADADTLGLADQLEPPPNGTIFRMLEIQPRDPTQTPEEAERAARATFAALHASNLQEHNPLDPMMHTTASLDYVVVLRGEITLLVDDGQTTLHPFDVVVQRGTDHYWINNGTEPVLMMGVMLDAR